MSEKLPSRAEERDRDKFASPRDRVLYTMCQEAWGMDSHGTDDPYAWCAWVSNAPAELTEIVDVFAEAIVEAGLTDMGELLGNYSISENEHGRVDVLSYETEDEARGAYAELEGLIEVWGGA